MTKRKEPKRRPPLNERVLAGAAEALAHARGEHVPGLVTHVPGEVDVKAIRQRTKLSQAAFSARYGFELRTLQNWETGARRPLGPARVLLTVIDKEREAVERALSHKAA